MKLETVPLGSISPDPANTRKHSRRNLDAIKASLRRFGQQKPIVVDAKGVVLAGNGTLAAATELGWSEIQIVRTALAGVDATAFGIADNRTAELAEWDDKLGDVLAALKAEEFPLAEIGFDEADLAELAGEPEPSDADAEPLLRQPRTHERGVVGKVGALATVFDDGRIFEGIPEGGARHAPRGHEAATPHELGSLRAQVAALTHLLMQGVVVPLPSLAGGGACSAGDGHSMHVWFGPAMVGVGGANAETAAGEPRWQWKLVPLCR